MYELRTTDINAHTSLCSIFTNNMYTNVPTMITPHITENMFGLSCAPVKKGLLS